MFSKVGAHRVKWYQLAWLCVASTLATCIVVAVILGMCVFAGLLASRQLDLYLWPACGASFGQHDLRDATMGRTAGAYDCSVAAELQLRSAPRRGVRVVFVMGLVCVNLHPSSGSGLG